MASKRQWGLKSIPNICNTSLYIPKNVVPVIRFGPVSNYLEHRFPLNNKD